MSVLAGSLVPLLAAALLAGCGGEAGGADPGAASLWITRDRGQTVLLEREVPAGGTAMQMLREHADVRTGHGGRFVEAIDGLAGSLDEGRDWFYFVNGLLADRGAAEYRVRPGDVIWWDFREWVSEREEVTAVVGAFPEPFLHGYDGRRRPAVVTYELPTQESAARALGELIGAERVVPGTEDVPEGANVLELVGGPPVFRAESGGAGAPVRYTFAGDAGELARDPARYRFRFEVEE